MPLLRAFNGGICDDTRRRTFTALQINNERSGRGPFYRSLLFLHTEDRIDDNARALSASTLKNCIRGAISESLQIRWSGVSFLPGVRHTTIAGLAAA